MFVGLEQATGSGEALAQEREIGVLADGCDDGVTRDAEAAALHGAQRELSAFCARDKQHLAAAQRQAVRIRSAHTVQACAVQQRDAFLQRFRHFFGLGRHLGALFETEQGDLVAQPACAARCVQRGAAATDHHQALAQRQGSARVGAGQVGGAVAHPGLSIVQRGQAFVARGAQGQVERIVLLTQAREIVGALDSVIAMHLDAQCHDAGDFTIENVACQPVGGDAVTHQSTQLRLRLVERDGKAHAAQLKSS